jgi:tetratricopeptide (TPR) repeat protein
VSKKHKHRAPPRPAVDIQARVEKALHENRTQQALELAKQLHKQEPTPVHGELLRKAYLARARQLRSQGYTRDALTVLQVAVQLDGHDSAWLEQIAQEMAQCGDVRGALSAIGRVPGAPSQGQVLGHAVDSAMQQEKDGRKLLPAELHADFDRILTTFTQVETGQDDWARETLQAIGLRSPFLEWKLLLRGLSAYYQGDDVRALENWQRLNPDRLPTRLAAPYRFLIDSAYHTAQPPPTQNALQKQVDRLQGGGLIQQLRQLQSMLVGGAERKRGLTAAFRQADSLVHALRVQAPQLVPRLADCFYWAIVTQGQPEDVPNYKRIFGTPADDPLFDRLNALACEHCHELDDAHHHWQLYERWVAEHPTVWPAGQAERVRALVWCHMGHNAASVPDPDRIPNLPPFLRDHPDRPRPLEPPAEECFRRGLELAPDQLDAYEALFHYHLERHEEDEAAAAGRRLLERFPDHVATLEELGDLRMKHGDHAEALGLFQRALKTNPLDRGLRHKLSTAHLFHARSFAEADRFAEARAEYRASLAFSDDKKDGSVLCKWAACEFKAGDPERAEELLEQALSEAGNRLAVAFSMLIEIIRLKLPRKLKSRFDKDFKDGLAEPATGAAAAALASTIAAHRAAGVTYHGQKTHEKKVLTYLDKAQRADLTEEQLEKVCRALLTLPSFNRLRTFTNLGQRKFPKNPLFPYLEAESFIALGPSRCPTWQVQPLLEKAQRLAQELPKGSQPEWLLEAIRARQQLIGMVNPFLSSFMDQMFDMFGDEDDDEDDDWDDGW